MDAFLDACGYPVPKDTYARVSASVSWREPIEALFSQLLATVTHRFAATHMAWGALNELTAAAAYSALVRHTGNPVLKTLLQRIIKQERKHFSFYFNQAQQRLHGDRHAQRLCCIAMNIAWSPVGSGVGHIENLRFVAAALFGDSLGRAALTQFDHQMQKLPGLETFQRASSWINKLIDDYERQHGALNHNVLFNSMSTPDVKARVEINKPKNSRTVHRDAANQSPVDHASF
ncbi:MAG: hypothetical protein R3C68_12865 [Myxococcota bacterium]